MAIKTPQQYIESLKDGRVVYCNGEKIEDVTMHPILNICRDWVAMDYVLQSDPRFQDLLLEKDADGELVSFALMPQKSREDLIRLREVVKLWARVCFGKPPGAKFVAKDGLNAVTVVSQRIDKKYGTNYAENVETYRKHLQKNDLAFAMGLTDVKGDRSPACAAKTPPGLLRQNCRGKKRWHHRERRQDPYQPGAAVQRDPDSPLPCDERRR